MREMAVKEMDFLEKDMRGLNPSTESYKKRKARYDLLYKKTLEMP